MSIELPEGLLDKIIARIHKEQRFSAIKKRLAIFSIGVVGSIVAFIPAFKMAEAEFSSSGFLQFLSLIFSDFGTVIAYWQNFSMSLLETLPVISLATLLAVIFIFLESLRFLAKDIKFILSPSQRLIIN